MWKSRWASWAPRPLLLVRTVCPSLTTLNGGCDDGVCGNRPGGGGRGGASAVHGDIYRFVLYTHIPCWPGQSFTVDRSRSHWRRARSAKCLSAPHYRLKFGPCVFVMVCDFLRPQFYNSRHCACHTCESVGGWATYPASVTASVCMRGMRIWVILLNRFPDEIKTFLNYRYISDVMCLEKWGKCHYFSLVLSLFNRDTLTFSWPPFVTCIIQNRFY